MSSTDLRLRVGRGFDPTWTIATLNLENGASNSQRANLIARTGPDCIYYLQEFIRNNCTIQSCNRSFNVFVNGSSEKRLAFIVPSLLTDQALERHILHDSFYALQFRQFVCVNVHARKANSEDFEKQLRDIEVYVRSVRDRPVIIAGDWNCSLGAESPPFVGPHHGDPRSNSAILLQFVLSLEMCVVNSWSDLGFTRRPPLSLRKDLPT